jgi:hypothetical protein
MKTPLMSKMLEERRKSSVVREASRGRQLLAARLAFVAFLLLSPMV